MASATGIPQASPAHAHIHDEGRGEDEPLLGRRGDVSQPEGRALYHNVYTGTAAIAQAGIVLLIASVWASVFLNKLLPFVSPHPLLNSAGILFITQAILIVQPTHTAQQKREGTIAHFTLNTLGVSSLIAGLIIIEINKFRNNPPHHFQSVHAILGLITYIVLALQALVGFTAYFVPQLYGGVNQAKSLYKWHRISGYIVFLLLLATVAAATQTDYNKNVLDIKLWAVLVCSVLIVIGVFPRIKKEKLGLVKPETRPSGAFGQ
ncbi:hypothetical protein HYFRA_00006049 [Hymenoscyphus fraxineus]|uniref:Cytochrome b561 domain-containing protein n=1 Tax=Hymenoscyphus fraxineus TaxID=746836 RepID=A0A9N9KYQ2_9HELO|nr:hypothetical protein HYFRA_00006049 [Hymenoscyphus fraxineus]